MMTTRNTLRILSWNIQHGRNSRGQIRLDQTIDYILKLGELDLICLQEVARHLASCVALEQPDQLAALCEAFEDYYPVWGAAFSWPAGDVADRGKRSEFGNLSLVRLPLLDKRVHVLPTRSESCRGKWQTPRCAVETLVCWRDKPVRILNVHLAYHCGLERRAQLEYLVDYQQQMKFLKKHGRRFDKSAPEIFAQPFTTRRALICGDFNLVSEGSDYHFMRESGWHDGWLYLNPAVEHQPTCGIHDRAQWPEGPHCRDYFWFQKLKPLAVRIDARTRCSDHQPLLGLFEL